MEAVVGLGMLQDSAEPDSVWRSLDSKLVVQLMFESKAAVGMKSAMSVSVVVVELGMVHVHCALPGVVQLHYVFQEDALAVECN